MKKLALGLLMAGIAMTGCSDGKKKGPTLIDAPVVNGDGNQVDMEIAACNVLTQTGCNANEKCTWFEDDMSEPPIGHIGCAPNGAKAIGADCTYGAPGATGFDDCVGGSVCVGAGGGNPGTCEAICDHQGGAPMCGTGFGCVRISGLFGPAMSTTPPAAGVCEVSCDPLADNDYDGSAAGDVRTGSACGTNANIGCYGNISDSGDRTHFICAGPAAVGGQSSGNLVHRNVIPANLQYLNSCHPGYTIAFAADATGSTNVDCYSYCKPGDSFGAKGSGAEDPPATQSPNGVQPNRCRVGGNDRGRSGMFGTVPNGATTPLWIVNDGTNTDAPPANSNGEHCMYSWNFEVDGNGAVHKSNTSDTIGICFDHSKYNADYDQNAGTPNQTAPACSRLNLIDPNLPDATNYGCVDTTTAGLMQSADGKLHVQNFEKWKKFAPKLIVPAFSPEWAGTGMEFQKSLR